ncbi:MAG TPA: hypothetical protein VF815_26630 [Myxococcaceae bacterium]
MLKTPMNEWILKAVQIETALLALGEIELPKELKGLRGEAEAKVQALLEAWRGRKPADTKRDWTQEEVEGGKPKDEELADVAQELKGEGKAYTLHRLTSGAEVVETLVAGHHAWRAAGGEYYDGQWDEDAKLLEVGRDDETDELGSGLVLRLTGELVYESAFED